MQFTRARTERPREALLQFNTGIRIRSVFKGGKQMVWQVIAQQNRYGNVTKSNKFYEKCLFSAENRHFFRKKA